jgi:SAM-dependent methyltransferase
LRDFWNSVADDWRIQVGDEGDENRRLNSDPVLWKFAGDVRGRRVLDAGCGTGYLTKKLHDSGAHVTGVDFSNRMVEIAREANPQLDFRVDCCSELRTCNDDEFDLLVSNYVLMDVAELDGCVRAFARVLKPRGVAVVVFSHPCFPQGRARIVEGDSRRLTYAWDFSYFERRRCTDPPWSHFKEEFIWFHRPLSDYWDAFRAAGFTIDEFAEPRISDETRGLARDDQTRKQHATRPYSVAFRLRKTE